MLLFLIDILYKNCHIGWDTKLGLGQLRANRLPLRHCLKVLDPQLTIKKYKTSVDFAFYMEFLDLIRMTSSADDINLVRKKTGT